MHTNGNVFEYCQKMKQLGEGLAPTSLIQEILKKVYVTCKFDYLSVRAFEEVTESAGAHTE